jgi:predicted phosphodiesterase
MVKIQIISDMHLEFRGVKFKRIIKPSAPILFLLGDICACGDDDDFETYKQFITFISPKFKFIFHVPGNHEYYNTTNPKTTMSDIDLRIKKYLKSFSNIFYLNNDTKRLLINNKTYVFVGAALWSNVRLKDRKEVGALMNDYSCIYVKDKQKIRKYNIEDMSKLHVTSVRYIKKIMKTIKSSEVAILLTHHKPIRDEDISNTKSQAYESDLRGIIITHPFKLAAHGHTHVKYDKVIDGVHVVSNPKGYISQKTRYDDTYTVSV